MTNKSVTPNKFPMVGIKAYTVNSLVSGEGILPSIRLMGMSRCMESHFQDCIDYNGVAFSMEWVTYFQDFRGKKILVSRDLKMSATSPKKDYDGVYNKPQNRL